MGKAVAYYTTAKDDIYAFIFGQKGLMAGLGVLGNKTTKITSKWTREPDYLSLQPTTFAPPPEAVDRLGAAVGTIILDSPEFQRLLSDVGATIVPGQLGQNRYTAAARIDIRAPSPPSTRKTNSFPHSTRPPTSVFQGFIGDWTTTN